jgi:hypothetical protein
MAESIWPYDIVTDPRTEPEPSPHRLTCFVLLPSRPKGKWDDLFAFIQRICDSLKPDLQIAEFRCERAIDITSAGVIHPEIWLGIKNADLIIADISGQNRNVTFELGIAAACREKHRVVIIREEDPEEAFLFDINPVRHLLYTRTYNGFQKLEQQLRKIIFESLAATPFEEIPRTSISLPFSAALDDGRDCDLLWTPDLAHRRMLTDCLEFGIIPPKLFKYSWLSVGDLKIRNVRITADMRFTRRGSKPGWIGIALRSQGFYANFSHLVGLDVDGKVWRTVPEDGQGKSQGDDIGRIDGFDPQEFTPFDVAINEKELRVAVGPVKKTFAVNEMPYVFGRGRILFQTWLTRAGVKNIKVEEMAPV